MTMKDKNKHQLRWFEAREGKYIIKNCSSGLFSPPILIASKKHAKAIYLTQNFNHTYNE